MCPRFFEDDVGCLINTILDIKLQSGEFSARGEMDIDIKDLYSFSKEISQLYEILSGKAMLKESYGEMFISFEGDALGHITVTGMIEDEHGKNSLNFCSEIDQTSLPAFLLAMQNYCGEIMKGNEDKSSQKV